MFEEASINPKLDVNQANGSQTSPSSQVSLGADEMMDELFHDLEFNLDDSTAVDDSALSTVVCGRGPSPAGHALLETPRGHRCRWLERWSPTGLRSSLMHHEDELLVAYTPMDSTLALQPDAETSLSLGLSTDPASTTSKGTGRWLMSTACVSLVGLSMFWVGRQVRWQHAPEVAAVTPATLALPEVKPDQIAFADYVAQSLERIDQEAKAEKLAAAAAAKTVNTPPRASLPDLSKVPKVEVASPNTNAIPSNAERVYVPVAEAPLPKLKAAPLPPPPANTPVIAAAKATPAKTSTMPKATPLPLTPPTNGERKFLGGTNLGDQPVFMVSINGSTRHVKIGEAIDETGATFVEFDGEQSVLKQGSQLKSVTAGQSF